MFTSLELSAVIFGLNLGIVENDKLTQEFLPFWVYFGCARFCPSTRLHIPLGNQKNFQTIFFISEVCVWFWLR